MTISPHVPATLIAGAVLHICGALFWPGLIPLRLLAFILLVSGYLGLLSALGRERPLNRLSAILAGYAAVGQLMWLLMPSARFGMLYIICLFAAFFVTSVAALHREGSLKRAGLFGLAATAAPLVAIIGGHIVLGGFGLLGLGLGYSAAQSGVFVTWPADLVLSLWAVAAGLFVLPTGGKRRILQ